MMNSDQPAVNNPIVSPVSQTTQDVISLDLKQARHNFGSDEALLCEIAIVFIEDVPLLVEQLEQAFQHGDEQTVCRMVHSLKGLCATFGAEPTRSIAQRIEHDCTHDAFESVTLERITQLVVKLEQTVATLRSELQIRG